MKIETAFDMYFTRFEAAPCPFREIELPRDLTRKVNTIKNLNMISGLVDWSSQRVEKGIEHYLWHPVKKDICDDLKKFEEEWNISIQIAIKEYFNTYWFLSLGSYPGNEDSDFFEEVELYPVAPWNTLDQFYYEYIDMRSELDEIGDTMNAVPIGQQSFGRLVVNCDNQCIYALNPSERQIYYVSHSLPSLIYHMFVPEV